MAKDEFDLAAYVGLVAPALNSVIIERLARRGFSGVKVSHGFVVQRLLNDEPTIGAIAEALGMTQQGASKQVADLERLGYAERVPVAGDQRARAVRLTPRGRSMVEATRRIRAQIERAVLARVGARSLAGAKKTLDALVDVVDLRERVEQRRVRAEV
jgi:DNA-binding MarR family transcriptional regulator